MPITPINRDPFCEVRLANIEHGGKATDKWLVEVEDEKGDMIPIPGVSGIHGADYALVPNRQVHDMVGDVLTRSGRDFKPVPGYGNSASKALTWDGARKYSSKWFCDDIAESLPGGHAIALGVEAVNSYDGSQPVGVRFFAMNMMCANQFYCSNLLGNFIFKHTTRDAGLNFQENVEDALKLMREQAERFLQVVPAFTALQNHKIDGMRGYLDFREDINDKCWKRTRDPDVLDELHHVGVTSTMGMQQSAGVDNLWAILNAYTAVSTHRIGGFNGSSISDRVTQFAMDRARR